MVLLEHRAYSQIAEQGAYEEIACPAEDAEVGLVSAVPPQEQSLDDLRRQLGPAAHLQALPAQFIVAEYAPRLYYYCS